MTEHKQAVIHIGPRATERQRYAPISSDISFAHVPAVVVHTG
jgi:hypothetical protein